MRIQTILNRLEKFKSFVYGRARLEERDAGPVLVVQVLPRKNGKGLERNNCYKSGRLKAVFSKPNRQWDVYHLFRAEP